MACGFLEKSKYRFGSSSALAPFKTSLVLTLFLNVYNLPAAHQATLLAESPYITFKPGA